MIKLTGRLVCKSAEEANLVRQYLPEHKELTREETGCVSFEVTETADPMIWKVEELLQTRLPSTLTRKEPGLLSGEEKPARSPESTKSQRLNNLTALRYVQKSRYPAAFLHLQVQSNLT